MQERRNEGLPEWGTAASGAASKKQARFRHFPPLGYVELSPIKFDPLLAAVAKQNEALQGGEHEGVSMSAEELGSFTKMIDVLKEEARYHATRIEEDQARLIRLKLLRWPVQQAAPVTDLLRKLATHVHAAESVLPDCSDSLVQFCERNAKAWSSGEAKPALAILTYRLLANLTKPRSTR